MEHPPPCSGTAPRNTYAPRACVRIEDVTFETLHHFMDNATHRSETTSPVAWQWRECMRACSVAVLSAPRVHAYAADFCGTTTLVCALFVRCSSQVQTLEGWYSSKRCGAGQRGSRSVAAVRWNSAYGRVSRVELQRVCESCTSKETYSVQRDGAKDENWR